MMSDFNFSNPKYPRSSISHLTHHTVKNFELPLRPHMHQILFGHIPRLRIRKYHSIPIYFELPTTLYPNATPTPNRIPPKRPQISSNPLNPAADPFDAFAVGNRMTASIARLHPSYQSPLFKDQLNRPSVSHARDCRALSRASDDFETSSWILARWSSRGSELIRSDEPDLTDSSQ